MYFVTFIPKRTMKCQICWKIKTFSCFSLFPCEDIFYSLQGPFMFFIVCPEFCLFKIFQFFYIDHISSMTQLISYFKFKVRRHLPWKPYNYYLCDLKLKFRFLIWNMKNTSIYKINLGVWVSVCLFVSNKR